MTTNAPEKPRRLPARAAPILFGLLLTGMMSFVVSGIATVLAIGVGSALVNSWAIAWASSWAVAFPVVLVVAPFTRRLVAAWTHPPEHGRSGL